MSIKTKIAARIKQLSKIQNEIYALQDECTHPNIDKQYKGSTGNWSKSDDSFWIEFKCLDCGKRWTENQ